MHPVKFRIASLSGYLVDTHNEQRFYSDSVNYLLLMRSVVLIKTVVRQRKVFVLCLSTNKFVLCFDKLDHTILIMLLSSEDFKLKEIHKTLKRRFTFCTTLSYNTPYF